MSIKRYFTQCGYECNHVSYEHPEGIWVDFNDHQAEVARLKAEVERLEGLVKYWQIEAETDHAHWVRHAETNERLRKAGDAMARIIAPPTHGTGEWDGEWDAWNAAKEGKQP